MILQLEYFPLLLIIYLFYSLLIANGLSFKDIYSTGKDFDITCIFADLTETLVALNNEGPTYPKTIHFNLKKKPTFDLHVQHILHFWLVVLIIYIGFAVFEPYASRR